MLCEIQSNPRHSFQRGSSLFKHLWFVINVTCLLCALGAQPSLAQTPADRQAQSPLVTAAATPDSVRFTAPARVYEMRLEVFAADGQTLYDSDFKLGNLLDWGLHDQQGQRLADGSYQCVVTVRALYGRASRKQGTIVLQDGQPTLQATQAPQDIKPLNLLAASEPGNFLALPSKEAALPLTVLAHDGQQGRLASGSGGLSFRTGDFFAGKDVELMRLTSEGKLGIGVENPQNKLDVGGLIRTSEGIVFPDGSVQTTAYVASGRSLSERVGIQRDVQGRSITEQDNKPIVMEQGLRLSPNAPTSANNSLVKFTSTQGATGDSNAYEVNGYVGIGTLSPAHRFDVWGSGVNGNVRFLSGGINLPVQSIYGRTGEDFTFGVAANANEFFTGTLPGDGVLRVFQPTNKLLLATGIQNYTMTIYNGNVGIGTLSPTSKLVVGAKVTDDNAYSYDANSLVITHQAQTSSTTLNDPKTVLVLARQGTLGQAFGAGATFNLSRYENNGANSRTRLDISLAHGTYDLTGNNIMTLLSSGNVGIGTTSPGYKLHVEGGSGTAIYGKSTSTSSFGVKGESTGDAVYGETSGSLGFAGVHGKATALSSYGVKGESNFNGNSYGVFGTATTGHGVWGESQGNAGFGVYGKNLNLASNAGYFEGNTTVSHDLKVDNDVVITHMLTKGSGAFKIDHPLDPENKYLYHSFVESPDMMNIYNGNVSLDEKGETVVSLPEWFGALNRDFRYQLTAIGGPGPNLYVAEEVTDNHFKIAGGMPGMKVSWQVTGIRQDPFANARRIPVEEEKSEKERGYYLHPGAYGQPEEKSVEWARYPEMMRQLKQQREKEQAEREKKPN